MKSAVIDVGSNSVLLTVGSWQNGETVFELEVSRVTALGEGVKQTGVLSEAAIERTMVAIVELTGIAIAHGAEVVRAYATMAVRMAKNQADFLDRCTESGVECQVLSGESEAYFGFLAVANDPMFSSSDTITIIDPGGQSTELVTAAKVDGSWQPQFAKSFPVGTLAMLSESLTNECATGPEILQASRKIDDLLGLSYLPFTAGTVVTLGATGTNLVSMRDRLQEWDPDAVHGASLDYEEVSKAVSWLSGLTIEERSKLIGMEPGREKTLHAGALILERFMFAVKTCECRVSVRGWRHAILQQLLEQNEGVASLTSNL